MKDSSSRPRILVVDDDQNMRQFLKDHLMARSHQVDVASSAGEALLKLMERRYVLAIMDVRMPLMDGVTCLRQCQNLDPEMKVIMISGEASPQEMKASLNSGAVEFMEKPIEMTELFRSIDKALSRRLAA